MSVGLYGLADELGGRVVGREHTGQSFAAACPACGDGRLLAWSWRPSGRRGAGVPAGFRCADCGEDGDLLRLERLIARRSEQ